MIAAVTALTLLVAACGSDAKHALSKASTPTTAARATAGSALSFREVLDAMPYGTATTAGTCEGGRKVTAPAEQAPDAHILLADRTRTYCYDLGPTLLTGTDVAAADAVANPSTSLWQVDVRFANDDFAKKVAAVEIGKQIAIVMGGVVQSAPTINAGITGNIVTISGGYDEATAREIAARIDPSSRSRIPETPTTTADEALAQAFDKRCTDVAPRLGLSLGMFGASTFPVDVVRSGFVRAHETVPSQLANLDGKQKIALCYFTTDSAGPDTSPTTVCPNGDLADIGPTAPEVMYVVDANLDAFRFPGIQYLLPSGMTVPAGPGPCAGLGSP
jgi:hypothetical protein